MSKNSIILLILVLVNNMLKKAGSDAPASEPTWDALRLNLATLLDFVGNDQFT
jgi:hypothetical protein